MWWPEFPVRVYRLKPIISTFSAFLLHFSKIASAKLRCVTCCHTGHPSFCTSFACSHDTTSMRRHRTWYLWYWHIHGLSVTLESWEWPSWRDTRFGHIVESLPSSRIASSEWEQWTETVYVSPGTIWSSAFVSWIAQRPCTVCDNTGNILSYGWETHWKPLSLLRNCSTQVHPNDYYGYGFECFAFAQAKEAIARPDVAKNKDPRSKLCQS